MKERLSQVFQHEEWLVGDDPLYLKFLAKLAPLEQKCCFARSISAVTPSKKCNRKSTTRFLMSLRWTSYVCLIPQRRFKTQNDRFPSKTALNLKKVSYKVSFCEYCQRQSCMAFNGQLYIRAKNGSRATSPTTWKFGRNWRTPFKNAAFQLIFAR